MRVARWYLDIDTSIALVLCWRVEWPCGSSCATSLPLEKASQKALAFKLGMNGNMFAGFCSRCKKSFADDRFIQPGLLH